ESVATIPPSLIVTSVVSLNNYTQCPTLAMLSRMPNTAVAIKLQAAERAQLQQWESSHGTPQQVALRCRIILAALAGQDNVSIAVDLGVSRPTEIMRFVEYWKQRTGHLPEELVFDSKLTTYRNLSRLNELGIPFITLRRRDPKMLQEIHTQPASAWRRIELESIARAYRTPRILDQTITLRDYDGPIRQITVADLGHEEPTIVV